MDMLRHGWILRHSEVVVASPWLTVRKNTYATGRGTHVIEDYFVVERQAFVLTVAVRGSEILLVHQYRPATEQWYWALPAGYLEKDELPEAAAIRELLEETGYKANNPVHIGELHPLPGYIRSPAFVVLCSVDSGSGKPMDTEEITEVSSVPMDTAIAMILRGEINEMQAVAAILLAHEYLASRG